MFWQKKRNKEDLPVAVRAILTAVQEVAESARNMVIVDINQGLVQTGMQVLINPWLPCPGTWLAQQYSRSSYMRTLLLGTRPDEHGMLVCTEYSVLLSRLDAVHEDLEQKLGAARNKADTALHAKLGQLRLQLELRTREFLNQDESGKPVTDSGLLKALMDELADVDFAQLPEVTEFHAMRNAAYKAAEERYQAVLDAASKEA